METMYKYIIDTNLNMYQIIEKFNKLKKKDPSGFVKIALTFSHAHEEYTLPWVLAWVVLRHDGLILHMYNNLEISKNLDTLLTTSTNDINWDMVKFVSWKPISLETLLREIDNVMEFKPWLNIKED